MLTKVLVIVLTIGAISQTCPNLNCLNLERLNMPLNCPNSPNCVSSDATNPRHAIKPFPIDTNPKQCWHTLLSIIKQWPNTHLQMVHDTKLHAVVHSRILRFKDDIFLELRSHEGIIAVKSASRLGYYDFGTNRKRVEAIRQAYLKQWSQAPTPQ